MREQGESDAGRYRARNEEMKLLVIDNYDSFTYNLVQLFGEMDVDLTVKRNDEISIDEIKKLKPDRICISPGPGRPEDAGISPDLIRELGPRVPILGVCLGHQCIAQAFGGGETFVNPLDVLLCEPAQSAPDVFLKLTQTLRHVLRSQADTAQGTDQWRSHRGLLSPGSHSGYSRRP